MTIAEELAVLREDLARLAVVVERLAVLEARRAGVHVEASPRTTSAPRPVLRLVEP